MPMRQYRTPRSWHSRLPRAVSFNRRHFLRLYQSRSGDHAGIVLCTFDLDFAGQARRIQDAVTSAPEMSGQLIRVKRPA